MKQIGLFRNENVPVPLLTVRAWRYVSANFDRTKGFTKIRLSLDPVIDDWCFSNIPGINSDGQSGSWRDTPEHGWGNHLRTAYSGGVAIKLPNNGDFTDFYSGWSDKTITSVGTYVGVGEDGYGVYEYEYPITIYWSGCNLRLYNEHPYKLQVYC